MNAFLESLRVLLNCGRCGERDGRNFELQALFEASVN